jgi:hypothetical protein
MAVILKSASGAEKAQSQLVAGLFGMASSAEVGAGGPEVVPGQPAQGGPDKDGTILSVLLSYQAPAPQPIKRRARTPLVPQFCCWALRKISSGQGEKKHSVADHHSGFMWEKPGVFPSLRLFFQGNSSKGFGSTKTLT